MTGSGTVLVKGGSIKNPHVIIKVLDFMSLQNIYKKKPSGRTENEFYFESIGGDAVINKGLLKTENLVMESPALKAVASGDLDMTLWTVEGKLGARPIETVDSVVSNIPILGYILTGEEKTILVYYFDVKGPLGNPEVKYIPFKTLGIGVASALKRLILSPVRLLKNLSEAAKKPPEFDASNLPGPGEP
jgi:uncharacterized protein YhdP